MTCSSAFLAQRNAGLTTNTASRSPLPLAPSHTTMKLSGAIAAICLASASAFAPAPVSRVSSSGRKNCPDSPRWRRFLLVMPRHGSTGSTAWPISYWWLTAHLLAMILIVVAKKLGYVRAGVFPFGLSNALRQSVLLFYPFVSHNLSPNNTCLRQNLTSTHT